MNERAATGTTWVDVFDVVAAVSRRFGKLSPRLGLRTYDSTAVAKADDQGIINIVAAAAAREQIVLDDDAEVMLSTLQQRATEEAVALEARAAAAVSLLSSHDIPSRLLKGVAVARLDYPLAELRCFGDIDLLVPGEQIGRAVEAFAAAGFDRHYPEPYDGFDEYIGKGVAVENSKRTVLDLHRTLALGYFGTRLDVDSLWAGGDGFDLAGTRLLALGRTQRFVHGALHMALSPVVRLIDAVDLCMIGRRPDALPTDDIVAVAEAWGCRAPVAQAITTTTGWLGPDWAPADLVAWSRSYRPTVVERVAGAAFDGPLSGSAMRSLTAMGGLRSLPLVGRAARSLLIPGHEERQ
ncbi:MAG: nucleotidyltransferase family protein [Ilumatobacteraceae bacterium]